MNDEVKTQLISQILAGQEDRTDIEVKSKDYWRDRIGKLSDKDRSLLAISPVNREVLNEAWRERRDAFVAAIRASNDNRPKMLAAAANGRRETIRFKPMQDFKIQIEPTGQDGWLIILELRRQDFPPRAVCEIYDVISGKVWLRGTPDEQREVTAIWHGDGDPREDSPELWLRIDGLDIG
jgi:hypothetical protein